LAVLQPLNPSKRSEGGEIQAVIARQCFDGYWQEALPGYDAISWADIKKMGSGETEIVARIRQTVFALAFLLKKAQDRRVLWDLVSQKAKQWLRAQDAALDWDDVIVRVAALIQ
jgi:hypothetical protein